MDRVFQFLHYIIILCCDAFSLLFFLCHWVAVSVFCVQVFLYCMLSFSFPTSFPENRKSVNLFFVPLVLWSWKILIIQASRFLLVLTLCQLRCLYLHMLISCVALLVIHSCCIYRPIALQLLWAAMWVLLRSVALRHSKNFHTNMHESNIRPNTIKSCRLLHVKRWS